MHLITVSRSARSARGHRHSPRHDGALGSRGAALLAPYSDKADTSGFLTQKPEELRPMFEEALRHGIQVETHAIGDRANRTILDLYEQAFKAVPAGERKIQEPRGVVADEFPDGGARHLQIEQNLRDAAEAIDRTL